MLSRRCVRVFFFQHHTGVRRTRWLRCLRMETATMPAFHSLPSGSSNSKTKPCQPTTCTVSQGSAKPVLAATSRLGMCTLLSVIQRFHRSFIYQQQCSSRRKRNVQSTDTSETTTLSSSMPIVTRNENCKCCHSCYINELIRFFFVFVFLKE